MKFRATAVGVVVGGHPLQYFSNSLHDALNWADKVANQYKASVEVYKISEVAITTVEPQP